MFDLAEGTKLAVEGARSAAAGAGESWIADAKAAVLLAAESKPASFTSDDVWATGLEKPKEPRALGHVMAILSRDGAIAKTGEYRKTEQVSRHAAPIAVWRKG